jgi:hypothetical protein
MASALWSSRQLSGQESRLVRQLSALYERLHEAAHDGPANRADHFQGLIQEARLLVEALPYCQAVMGAGAENEDQPQVGHGVIICHSEVFGVSGDVERKIHYRLKVSLNVH